LKRPRTSVGRQGREPVAAPLADCEAQALRSLYGAADALLPERDCRRRTTCCRFAETGREPWVTDLEVAWLTAFLRASGRVPGKVDEGGDCPLLAADGRTCTAYEARPLGCRTHFCREAGGSVGPRLLRDVMQDLASLDEARGGSGKGRPLRRALAEAFGRRNGRGRD
jgi:hypothetical protein